MGSFGEENYAPGVWGRNPGWKNVGCCIASAYDDYSLLASFEDRAHDLYLELDLETKLCALKISQSVVSLVSLTGEDEIVSACSGTIIGCDWQEKKGTYAITILTSANLLRRHGYEDDVPTGAPERNLKVHVYSLDDSPYLAEVFEFNIYYNLAMVKFESSTYFPTASLKGIKHSGPVIPKGQQRDSKSSEPYPRCHTSMDPHLFNICPGDKVIAVGRHHLSRNLMAAPGAFSFGCTKFDCGELVRASCLISLNGTGGPLINCNGEVIGINFFHGSYTAFLPTNIAYKCIYHLNHRSLCEPWVGMKVAGLNVINANKLERILLQLPGISEGVIVEEVVSESPAHCAGILKNDVITQCDGKRVGSSTEFFEIWLDKLGGSLQLMVGRPDARKHFPKTVTASAYRCDR